MHRHIVVIGSGLAGTLLCNQLAGKAHVTLLEAGEKDRMRFPRIEFLNKRFGEVDTLCIAGGGTTNLWHNGLIPIHPEDVTSPMFREILMEAVPYIDKAASMMYFKSSSYFNAYRAALSEMSLISDSIGTFSDGIDCLIYPKNYRKLTPEPRVHACYTVSDIDFTASGPRIQKIVYRASGKKEVIYPDKVVICAGALGSPRLIEMIVPSRKNPGPVLGGGLMDHPMGFVGKVKFKKEIASLIDRLSLSDKASYQCRSAVRLKSDCGRYTGCVFFRPALTMDNRLSISKFKSSIGASSGRRRFKNICSAKILHPDIMAEIFTHLCGVNIPTRIYNILFLGEQKREGNSVSYDGDRIRVDWRISSAERSLFDGMLRKLKRMLSGIADAVDIIPRIGDDWLWSAAHHSGTISMGAAADSLVDKDLKLHGCDNVFVCDGSVIQEHSYANTGLTIGALALRLAENVLR